MLRGVRVSADPVDGSRVVAGEEAVDAAWVVPAGT